MNFATKVANAAHSFAHLAGIAGRKAAAKAEVEEDDKDKKKPAEEAAAEGEKPEDEDKEKGAKAADDKPEEEDEGEDDDKKSKAKAADGEDDDPDEEMRGNSAAAQARRREQARCAAIFASPMAAKNPVLAAKLAFNTRMPRDEAVALLEGTPAPSATHVNSAARAERNPTVGANGGQSLTAAQRASASMDRAFAKANPVNAQRLERAQQHRR